MSTGTTTTTQATDQQLQDEYVQTMIDNFNEAQADLEVMQESSDDMIDAEEDQTHHKQGHKKWNEDQDRIDQDQATYDAAEEDLLSIDPGMYSFCQTQDQFLESASQVQDQKTRNKDQRSDLETIQSDMDANYGAGSLQLQADMYSMAIGDDTDGDLTDQQYQYCAQQSINLTGQEQSSLLDLEDTMTDQVEAYSQEENDAEVKKSKHSYATGALLGGTGELMVWMAKSSAQKTINNDNFMIDSLLAAMSDLGNQMVQSSPQMLMLNDMMQVLLRKAAAIMKDDDIPMNEKQNQILQLMMLALGVFNQVKAQTESDKEENTMKMSQANVDAANMNMDNIQANQTIQANMERHEKIMSIEMRVVECTMIALMSALAPGYGTMAMILIMGALEQSGLLDMATEKLGNVMGSKWGADVLVAAAEIGLTLGAGAADIVAERAMTEVTEYGAQVAMEAVETEIEENAALIGERVAGKAGEEGLKQVTTEEAEQQIRKVAEEAADKAAKSMTEEFLRQPAGTLIEMLAKGTLKTSLQTAVTEAAEQAARIAIENANTALVVEDDLGAALADDAIAEGIEFTVQPLSDEMVQSISQNASDTAVRDQVAEQTGQSKNKIEERMAKRASGMATAQTVGTVSAISIANTNLLVDSMKAIMDKTTEDADAKWAKDMLIAAKVLELLIEMIGMIVMAGGPSSLFETSPSTWIQVANVAEVIGQGSKADSEAQIGTAKLKQATAEKNLAIDNAISQQIQVNQDQIMKMASMSQQQFIGDLRQSLALQYQIAGHLMDSDLTAARILASAV